MKILKIRISGLFEQRDVDISFREDLNFLVGNNGAGKTTILKILNAAILVDIQYLLRIKFQKVQITIKGKNNIIIYEIEKKSDEIFFRAGDNFVSVDVPHIKNPFLYDESFGDYSDDLRRRVIGSSQGLRDFFDQMDRPLFLGLDRKRFEAPEFKYVKKRSSATRPVLSGGVLIDVVDLIRDAYLEYRRVSDMEHDKFKSNVVNSIFKFSDLDFDSYLDYAGITNFLESVKHREVEIDRFFTASDRLGFYEFVEKVTTELGKLDEVGPQRGEVHIKMLANHARIKMVIDMMDAMKKVTSISNGRYKPIQQFVDAANLFFCDSGKAVEIDGVGNLQIIGRTSLVVRSRLIAHVLDE